MTTEGGLVSHGRGGAGNIGGDTTEYVDGEIVRSGSTEPGSGPVSTGRGGAANIVPSPKVGATEPATTEHVPEAALRPSSEGRDYHVGRGGQGNLVHGEGHESKEPAKLSLADKLKNKLFKKKADTETPTTTTTT